jgi:hypothetical protein
VSENTSDPDLSADSNEQQSRGLEMNMLSVPAEAWDAVTNGSPSVIEGDTRAMTDARLASFRDSCVRLARQRSMDKGSRVLFAQFAEGASSALHWRETQEAPEVKAALGLSGLTWEQSVEELFNSKKDEQQEEQP